MHCTCMQLNYTRKASNGVKIDRFGSWLQANNPQSDDDPQHVDAGTLFTRYDYNKYDFACNNCISFLWNTNCEKDIRIEIYFAFPIKL